MDLQFLHSLFPVVPAEFSPLLLLAVILIGGASGGWIAVKLRAPAITGNILAGALLGLTLFRDVDVARHLQPLSTFAISLIAVTAGGHFSIRRIHNAMRRILFISFFEIVVSVSFVGLAMYLLDAEWQVAVILACLAAGTAPGTTVAVIRENLAKGPFVKTLLAVVSIDSAICILLFAFVHTLLVEYYVSGQAQFDLVSAASRMVFLLLGSVAIAVGLGALTSRLFESSRFHNLSTKAVAILIAAGVSTAFGLSPLLTCLIFGVYLGNSSQESERQLRALEPLEPLLFTCFFTLAGVDIHLEMLAQAGLLCVVYVIARASGKALGASVGAFLSRCSARIRSSIPFGFVPQAGVALGLVVILEGDPRIPSDISSLVGTLVIAAVTINEIIGPFITRTALRRAQEAGLDRPRLVEFLQEEYILPNLVAEDKWDALRKMTDFYIRTHKIRPQERDALYASLEDRENQQSTAIGLGAAIPHGKVESGSAIQGILAICPDGVDFDSPDGLPTKLFILIVTPAEHEARHLDVLASLMAMISNTRVRTRLMTAVDANDAWEIIESGESRTYNYFLEEGAWAENDRGEA